MDKGHDPCSRTRLIAPAWAGPAVVHPQRSQTSTSSAAGFTLWLTELSLELAGSDDAAGA